MHKNLVLTYNHDWGFLTNTNGKCSFSDLFSPWVYSDGGTGPVYWGASPGNLGDVISAVSTSALAFLTGYCCTAGFGCLGPPFLDGRRFGEISSWEDNCTNWRPVGNGILVGGPCFCLAMASWNQTHRMFYKT